MKLQKIIKLGSKGAAFEELIEGGSLEAIMLILTKALVVSPNIGRKLSILQTIPYLNAIFKVVILKQKTLQKR